MIRFTSQDGRPFCVAELKGFGIYLDHDSIIDLAKGCPLLRRRFVDALQRGGTLLFSWANAIELAGPQGRSATAARAFLDSLGAHWIPLELSPWTVVEQENADATGQAPVSKKFMKAYFQERASDVSLESKVLDLSAENFFRLGAVLDWVHANRDSVRQWGAQIDGELENLLKGLRAKYESYPESLDQLLPPVPFDERRPAMFVSLHLQRTLVREAKAFRFKKHDGLDFCHAVVGTAYGSLATLDNQWKQRIERLPQNRLAKTYYSRELDQLVAMLESLVTGEVTAGETFPLS